MIHLDTSFLVDLLREQERIRFGAASTCLVALPEEEVLAVSVIEGAPLITRNVRHFSKVPGLQIIEY